MLYNVLVSLLLLGDVGVCCCLFSLIASMSVELAFSLWSVRAVLCCILCCWKCFVCCICQFKFLFVLMTLLVGLLFAFYFIIYCLVFVFRHSCQVVWSILAGLGEVTLMKLRGDHSNEIKRRSITLIK